MYKRKLNNLFIILGIVWLFRINAYVAKEAAYEKLLDQEMAEWSFLYIPKNKTTVFERKPQG